MSPQVTRNSGKQLILLVALTGIEPGLFAFSCSYKLLKRRSQEPPCSQESQAVCTKHVHGCGDGFQGSWFTGLALNHDRRIAQPPFLPAP